MGQYHLVVNLDKKEYLDPFRFGGGLKLWEQIANFPSTQTALMILLACSNGRGGGDIEGDEAVIGRWAGDRIVVIGDYADKNDLPAKFKADEIYSLCIRKDEMEENIQWAKNLRDTDEYTKASPEYRKKLDKQAKRILKTPRAHYYKDIAELVAPIIESALLGKFVQHEKLDFLWRWKSDD